jgi:NAD(P)-dependent dehydrogenase (short-subunit alcohol dehydrogenase family)
LILGDISEPELEETRKLILEKYSEAKVVTSKLDVLDETSVDAFYALAVEKFDRIDFAVNIASAEHPGAPSIDVPQSDFQASYNEILRAVCSRLFIKRMSLTRNTGLPL